METTMLAMGDWFANLDAGTVKLVVIFSTAALVGIVAVVAHAWRRARESDNKAQITAMMLERNMPTEEIERILRAGVGAGDVAAATKIANREEAIRSDPEAHVIQHLAEASYEGGDVERILSAARAGGPVDARTARIVEGLADQWMETDDIVRILNVQKCQAGGRFDAAQLGEALREKGFSQKQIDVVLAKTA